MNARFPQMAQQNVFIKGLRKVILDVTFENMCGLLSFSNGDHFAFGKHGHYSLYQYYMHCFQCVTIMFSPHDECVISCRTIHGSSPNRCFLLPQIFFDGLICGITSPNSTDWAFAPAQPV